VLSDNYSGRRWCKPRTGPTTSVWLPSRTATIRAISSTSTRILSL